MRADGRAFWRLNPDTNRAEATDAAGLPLGAFTNVIHGRADYESRWADNVLDYVRRREILWSEMDHRLSEFLNRQDSDATRNQMAIIRADYTQRVADLGREPSDQEMVRASQIREQRHRHADAAMDARTQGYVSWDPIIGGRFDAVHIDEVMNRPVEAVATIHDEILITLGDNPDAGIDVNPELDLWFARLMLYLEARYRLRPMYMSANMNADWMNYLRHEYFLGNSITFVAESFGALFLPRPWYDRGRGYPISQWDNPSTGL